MYQILSIILLIKIAECCDCTKEKDEASNFIKIDLDDYADDIKDVEVDLKKETKEKDNSSLEEERINENGTNICPFYKNVPELNMVRMLDVWQTAYYISETKLDCFKIRLKKITESVKKDYKEKYGDFNNTINWNKCFIQLMSNDKESHFYVHLLQAVGSYVGVMENIVLSEESRDNVTIITLQESSPDQWLVVDNLLLMRDCDNGNVVVFSRDPYKPFIMDINEALRKFGEKPNSGNWACENRAKNVLQNPKYHKYLN